MSILETLNILAAIFILYMNLYVFFRTLNILVFRFK